MAPDELVLTIRRISKAEAEMWELGLIDKCESRIGWESQKNIGMSTPAQKSPYADHRRNSGR